MEVRPSHMMVDLETMSTRPHAAILSVGAVMFDPASDVVGEALYHNVEVISCYNIGLVKDASTEAWWSRQSKEAREALEEDKRHVREVARSLSAFWRRCGGVHVWSHGSGFDIVILDTVYRALGMSSPWKFWNARDTRTLFHMVELDHRLLKFDGVKHNALDDARHQVRCVQQAYAKLKGNLNV